MCCKSYWYVTTQLPKHAEWMQLHGKVIYRMIPITWNVQKGNPQRQRAEWWVPGAGVPGGAPTGGRATWPQAGTWIFWRWWDCANAGFDVGKTAKFYENNYWLCMSSRENLWYANDTSKNCLKVTRQRPSVSWDDLGMFWGDGQAVLWRPGAERATQGIGSMVSAPRKAGRTKAKPACCYLLPAPLATSACRLYVSWEQPLLCPQRVWNY